MLKAEAFLKLFCHQLTFQIPTFVITAAASPFYSSLTAETIMSMTTTALCGHILTLY